MDFVDVTVLLPPGQTPHGYNLSPNQTEWIVDADFLIVVGLGVDPWAEQAYNLVSSSGARILKMEDEMLPERNHVADPHVWLDPLVMMGFVRELAETFAEIDPANRDYYLSRSGEYAEELKRLDESCRNILSGVERKAVVTVHPAFSHFAARYGLEQKAIYSHDVQDHGPRHLEEVTEFIRKNDVKTIFSEPQFPRDKIAAIASQTDCVIRMLDPIGNPGIRGRDSYIALMFWNLEQLKEALGEKH